MSKQAKTQSKRKVPIRVYTVLVLVAMAGIWIYHNSRSSLVFRKQTVYDETEKQVDNLRCLETLLAELRKKAKFETNGTGEPSAAN